jgi:transposase-like protein
MAGKLAVKKELAVAALISEPTISAAARKVGINRTTLLKWLKLPEFRESFNEAKRIVFGEAITQLQKGAWIASKSLVEIVEDKDVNASIKCTAASIILSNARSGIELDDLQERIARIEASLETVKAANQGTDNE